MKNFMLECSPIGNRTVGKILDRKNETLTMYDKSKKKYSEEIFEEIRNNKGSPTA